MNALARLRSPRPARSVVPPTRTNGVIALPPHATASGTSMAAIAMTHDRVRAILGSHLWKLGFVTERIELPTNAVPRPDTSWEVRVVARRRAQRRPVRRRRRDRDD